MLVDRVAVDADVHGGDVGLIEGEHGLGLGTPLRPVEIDHNNGNIIGARATTSVLMNLALESIGAVISDVIDSL